MCGETTNSVTIKSYVGVALSEPFAFLEQNDDGTPGDPLDIAGWKLEVVISNGTAEYPTTEVLRFTQADGTITRDNGTGTFTVVLTAAAALALAPKRYAFRAMLFLTGETTPFDLPFRGNWIHQVSGEA
jgi:hypothetical protein